MHSGDATTRGVILGTVSYMSPEQARADKVDQRTDIFSLGVVLEMVTGARPFKGKSAVDTLHAIINQEPPLVTEVNSHLPPELADIMAKALAKETSERYQHAGDFELDLRRFKRALESNSLISKQIHAVALPEKATKHAIVLWSIIGAIFILGMLIASWLGRSYGRADCFGLVHFAHSCNAAHQLRWDRGIWSVITRWQIIGFRMHGGTPHIWLRQIAGGDPVRLTNDAEEERDLVFASDGETIYFTRIDASGPSIYRIGILGGQARRIVGNARMPVPSPDGGTLAFFVPDSDGTGDTLAVSALDGSATRTMARRFTGGNLNGKAVLLPDGHWLAYNRWDLFAPLNLFVVDVSTGRERQVTQFKRSGEGIESQVWLPDNRHLVVSYVLKVPPFKAIWECSTFRMARFRV